MLIQTRHPSRLTVPRLALLGIAVIGALVALAYPPAPVNDGAFRCQNATEDWEGVERLPSRLDDGRRVVLEQCRQWVDWRRWRHRVRAVTWRHDRELVTQTLFDGVTTEEGVEIRTVPSNSPLEIRYDCGNLEPRSQAPDTCSRQWRWSDHQEKLIVISPVR